MREGEAGMNERRVRLAVDIGGTFTDVVLDAGGAGRGWSPTSC